MRIAPEYVNCCQDPFWCTDSLCPVSKPPIVVLRRAWIAKRLLRREVDCKMECPAPNLRAADGEWIALAAVLSGNDVAGRSREVATLGYMLAYARQTDAQVLAVASDAEQGLYKLLFSFSSVEDVFDFMRMLYLNEATAHADVHIPLAAEIDSARPISCVLPANLIPQILQFADVLLSYRNGPVGMC